MEQASIQQSAYRSGHAPELPLDLIGFESNFVAPVAPANDSKLDEIVAAEDEQLRAAIGRGYSLGIKAGSENLRSWCAASMIGGALAMFLFAGAFPEWASMFIRHEPAPLAPAALASLTAVSR